MKRFACHYLYVSTDGCYSKYVVELEENDTVKVYFPLKEEISETQWIGGVIILSPLSDLEIFREETFVCFLKRSIVETNVPIYAWYITGFNLKKEEFTTTSKAVRL